MTFGIESLIIALSFLLPGFLTSSLISARTPKAIKEMSAFQETFDSLLRSVYIHLLISPFIYILVKYVFVSGDSALISRINNEGVLAFYSERPFQASLLLFGWLVSAFILAIVFGYKWDPLEILFSQLVKKTGSASEDIFYQLSKQVVNLREQGHPNYQLWIQARLKNGYTYRGEFYFAGYRHEGSSRELVLTNVKFFPYSVQVGEDTRREPRLYNFVLIDVANCDSLEFLFADS